MASRAKMGTSQMPIRLSEAEVSLLLQEAARQYEECIQIANLADLSEPPDVCFPKYTWDDPIGLVITDSSCAKLV